MFETFVKGQLAVLEVEKFAALRGIVVSKPTVEARYDLVLDITGKLYRVQIKYCNGKHQQSEGSALLKLTKQCRNNGKGRNYQSSEVDLIAVFLPETGGVAWLNPSKFHGKSSVTLRYQKPKNNQSKGILLVDDCTLEAALLGP